MQTNHRIKTQTKKQKIPITQGKIGTWMKSKQQELGKYGSETYRTT